ncbi:N-acetyl-gamma-glutamyl-phosphate reductase, partial [Sutterella wadsworthensis]
ALAPIFAAQGAVVFDLSGAYRLPNASDYPKFYGFEHEHPELLDRAVYALGEFVDRGKLRAARIVSLPGCYPTASQLALKPLIDAGLLAADFKPVIDAVSGVSGAGRKAKIGNAFCEVSLSAYGVFTHRHRPEIEAHLGRPVIFTPHLGPFKRGILATITVKLAPGLGDQSQAREKIQQAYESAYAACPLVRLRPALPKLDDVVNLPFCDIGFSVDEEAGYAVVVSAIDNLIKGAAGQAVQVMNLRFGFPETKGLL